ncbi:1,6-anhydro-N-acetylmuramyl-L-alanine amidase AmpD [Arhodomonas sp. AD133]|uniref:1,6-anhydro-N-acetylmuramyl-L-alanine amidase AmpD n=1 Tax=Arhodomonas sp. AD133 TaxID=3415009 RepID=UPI003EBFA146
MAVHIDHETDWIAEARWCPSPNWDERPADTMVDAVIIHGISLPPGEFGGPWIDRLFTNALDPAADPFFATIEGLRVSSHLLVRRDGELVQYVGLDHRAWHAGVSSLAGRQRCNDFAIGIELEGTDDCPYSEHQYQRLLPLLEGLMGRYPAIRPERVVGHCHVAPGRKSDPGEAFDWSRLASLGIPEPEATG